MPRRSRNQITKEGAKKIIKKLKAVKVSGTQSAHDQFEVLYEDTLVTTLSLRRGSQRNKGHDFIPGELGVGPNFAKQMAACTKSRIEYLKRIGIIEEDEDKK
jgi:hypothetical protein